MPQIKVQPIDSPTTRESMRTVDSTKPVLKSRLRRIFDRQFPGVLRVSAAEKSIAAGSETHVSKESAAATDFEPGSICLANLVQNFIEDSNDKQSGVATAGKYGRNPCNCFNGNNKDSSDDEFDSWNEFTPSSASHGDLFDIIKSLVPCTSKVERNLLADTAKIVELQSKSFKRKDELRSMVTDGLSALGYDAAICKSRWEKSLSLSAGDYEYIDVVVAGGGERILIDVDFRSEFDIARSTGTYKTILQTLPFIFVGDADRLEQIISAVSEAAKQSLKKKGMHIPPWRKGEYMKAKWLSSYTRATSSLPPPPDNVDEGQLDAEKDPAVEKVETCAIVAETETEIEAGELVFIFGESLSESNSGEVTPSSVSCCGGKEEALNSPVAVVAMQSPWQLPAVRPRSSERGGAKVVTGLASLLREKL